MQHPAKPARLLAAVFLIAVLVSCRVDDEPIEDLVLAPPTAVAPTAPVPTGTSPLAEERPGVTDAREPYTLADLDCDQDPRWSGNNDLLIFFDPDASQSGIDDIESALELSGVVESLGFINKEQAMLEFQELFADTAVADAVSVADIPTRFEVVVAEPVEDNVASLIAALSENPLVIELVDRPQLCFPPGVDLEVLCTDVGLPTATRAMVFLNPDASQADIDRVGEQLLSSDLFDSIAAVDQAQAYEDFLALGLEVDVSTLGLDASDMPPSFELELPSLDLAQTLFDELEDDPAVFDVVAGSPQCDLPTD